MRKILILFSIFVLTGLFASAQNDLKQQHMIRGEIVRLEKMLQNCKESEKETILKQIDENKTKLTEIEKKRANVNEDKTKNCRELLLVYTGAGFENDCELINAFIRKLSKDYEQEGSLPNTCLTILGDKVCTELFTKLINLDECIEDTKNDLKIILTVNNSILKFDVIDTLYQPKNVPYKFWMDYKKIQRINKPVKIK